MMINLRGVYKKGQKVFIIGRRDGVPVIERREIKSVVTTHVRLVGGLPVHWLSNKNIEPFLGKNGIEQTIARFVLIESEAEAKKVLQVELAEALLARRKKELEVLEKAVGAGVVEYEPREHERNW